MTHSRFFYMTHSLVWHDVFTPLTWLVQTCAWLIHSSDVTHPCATYAQVCERMTWLIHSVTWLILSLLWRGSFTRVHDSFTPLAWLTYVPHTRRYVNACHDSFTCVTCLIHSSDMTHPSTRVTWLIQVPHTWMNVMTPPHMWHDLSRCHIRAFSECHQCVSAFSQGSQVIFANPTPPPPAAAASSWWWVLWVRVLLCCFLHSQISDTTERSQVCCETIA